MHTGAGEEATEEAAADITQAMAIPVVTVAMPIMAAMALMEVVGTTQGVALMGAVATTEGAATTEAEVTTVVAATTEGATTTEGTATTATITAGGMAPHGHSTGAITAILIMGDTTEDIAPRITMDILPAIPTDTAPASTIIINGMGRPPMLLAGDACHCR